MTARHPLPISAPPRLLEINPAPLSSILCASPRVRPRAYSDNCNRVVTGLVGALCVFRKCLHSKSRRQKHARASRAKSPRTSSAAGIYFWCLLYFWQKSLLIFPFLNKFVHLHSSKFFQSILFGYRHGCVRTNKARASNLRGRSNKGKTVAGHSVHGKGFFSGFRSHH